MVGFVTSIALATWASLGGVPFERLEQPTPQMAVESAAKCGVGPVTIRYEQELQEDILSAQQAASATESQLVCLDKATGFGITVELPRSVQPKFDAIREARASEIMRSEARDWLSKRGLLERVPQYVRGSTDEVKFTREVEHLCGAKAAGAFRSRYGPHVLNPQWIEKMGLPPSTKDMDVMSCIFNVTTLAGFDLAFIGNEAYPH